MRDSPIPQFNAVKETENDFFIHLEYIATPIDGRETAPRSNDTALVFIHGGAFFAGRAKASRSLMQRYAGAAAMDVYLLKYPVGESDIKTVSWIDAAIDRVKQPRIILVASSAGAFWASYYMCFRYSDEFRLLINKATTRPLTVNKETIAFISLCGLIDSSRYKPRELRPRMGTLFTHWFLTPILIDYVVGGTVNPYICMNALDHIPFLLIDGRGVLSFAGQIERLKVERNARRARQTLLYIFEKVPHNFMYNWRLPESREVASIVKAFILSLQNRERVIHNTVVPAPSCSWHDRTESLLCSELRDLVVSQRLEIGGRTLTCLP